MDCSLLGSSVHGILQARILEWIAMHSSRGSFRTQGSNPHPLRLTSIGRQVLYHWCHPGVLESFRKALSIMPSLCRLTGILLWDYFLFFFFIIEVCIVYFFLIYLFFFICSGFCHTLKWNSHGFTCVPHPNPPSHLPLHPLPLGFPSAPGPNACLMHPTWAGDLFHPR